MSHLAGENCLSSLFHPMLQSHAKILTYSLGISQLSPRDILRSLVEGAVRTTQCEGDSNRSFVSQAGLVEGR